MVKLLLEKGASPGFASRRPLCVTVEMGRLDIVKILVEHGADVNETFSDYAGTHYDNALYIAKKKRHREIVKFLKANGAK